MIRYDLSFPDRHRQFIQFRAVFPAPEATLRLQLPAWRPGRYELGDFAKNIRSVRVSNGQGKGLVVRKFSKDGWLVECPSNDAVILEYQYAAETLNAGSTWLDAEQVYVNPVNCFFFDPDRQEESFEIHLELPKETPIVCQLPHSKLTLQAPNVQALMDAPFIASEKLKHWTYEVANVTYRIWVMGQMTIDPKRFVEDHRAFTGAMVTAFGSIPCEEYHFMYQFPAFPARHGVEHQESTVIAMGPAESLKGEAAYRELIGIACHELYHVWNVKSIRPIDWLPYDFTQENFSELGYVAEGVTTWFGDAFLHQCGVFDDAEFFQRFATSINRHLWNPGRFNMSVAASGWDTWLDGYVAGIPWRKVSIYNEGALVAFICDARIREATGEDRTLSDAMRVMYERFGQNNRGYTAEDYQRALEEVSGTSFEDIFADLLYGTEDYLPYLQHAIAYRGWQLHFENHNDPVADRMGMLVRGNKVVAVWPDGPADKAGIWYGDEISTDVEAVRMQLVHTDHIALNCIKHGSEQEFSVALGEGFFPKARVTSIAAEGESV